MKRMLLIGGLMILVAGSARTASAGLLQRAPAAKQNATNAPRAKSADREALLKEGARLLGNLHSAMDRFGAERDLLHAAAARVAGGKRPSFVQRWKLSALQKVKEQDVTEAREAFMRPLDEEGRGSNSLGGGSWVRAVESAQTIDRLVGRRTEPELQAELRGVHAAIFNRFTHEVDELVDPGMSFKQGLGVDRLESLRWATGSVFYGQRYYQARTMLRGIFERAEKAGALGADGYARWARTDFKLSQLPDVERPPSKIEPKVAEYLRTRAPKEQMGDLAPEELLTRLANGDVSEWRTAFKPAEHGTWESQTKKGLQLSFGHSFQRQLEKISQVTTWKNPLEADQGLALLKTLRADLAKASSLGVTMDGAGETRARLRNSLSPEKLAETEARLEALKAQRPLVSAN